MFLSFTDTLIGLFSLNAVFLWMPHVKPHLNREVFSLSLASVSAFTTLLCGFFLQFPPQRHGTSPWRSSTPQFWELAGLRLRLPQWEVISGATMWVNMVCKKHSFLQLVKEKNVKRAVFLNRRYCFFFLLQKKTNLSQRGNRLQSTNVLTVAPIVQKWMSDLMSNLYAKGQQRCATGLMDTFICVVLLM